MNNSNAAAKARRAGIKQNNPAAPPSPSNGTMQNSATTQGGLTLPQVISVIDKRLITLETFMKETKENPVIKNTNTNGETGEEDVGFIVPSEFNTFVDEINNRFQLLAEELETMKNALLKLQTFTMDVNKVILEKANVIVPDSVEDAVVQLSVDPTTDENIVVEETLEINEIEES
jgi:hypothetical protein